MSPGCTMVRKVFKLIDINMIIGTPDNTFYDSYTTLFRNNIWRILNRGGNPSEQLKYCHETIEMSLKFNPHIRILRNRVEQCFLIFNIVYFMLFMKFTIFQKDIHAINFRVFSRSWSNLYYITIVFLFSVKVMKRELT